MSHALPGEHLCKDHQGNTSHYARENCTICRLRADLAAERSACEELHKREVENRQEIAELRLNMKAVWNFFKPNKSNDMPWSDEIIVAHQNAVADAVADLKARLEKAERERDALIGNVHDLRQKVIEAAESFSSVDFKQRALAVLSTTAHIDAPFNYIVRGRDAAIRERDRLRIESSKHAADAETVRRERDAAISRAEKAVRERNEVLADPHGDPRVRSEREADAERSRERILEIERDAAIRERDEARDQLAHMRTALKSLESLHEQSMAVASASNSQKVRAISDALALITQYGGIDGGHHKQWVLDQIVRKLAGENYQNWVAEYDDGDGDEHLWDVGIAP